MDKDACLDSTAELGCFDNGQGLRFRVWGKGYWIFYAQFRCKSEDNVILLASRDYAIILQHVSDPVVV